MAFKSGQSGNPSGRPQGALNRSTRAAQALLAGEVESLTRKAVELALEGNIAALKLCLERIMPPAKAVTPPESFALPDGGSLTEQARAILAQVAEGGLSPSVGAELVDMVATAARIEEIDNLRDELNSLKRVLVRRKKWVHLNHCGKVMTG